MRAAVRLSSWALTICVRVNSHSSQQRNRGGGILTAHRALRCGQFTLMTLASSLGRLYRFEIAPIRTFKIGYFINLFAGLFSDDLCFQPIGGANESTGLRINAEVYTTIVSPDRESCPW